MSINDEIIKQQADISQARSNYQIDKFVIGQHDTPEMQYQQILLESSSLIRNLEEIKLDIELLEAEIEELLASGKKTDEIKAKKKQININSLKLSLSSGEKELAYLQNMYEQFPKFTREEVEAAQKTYWEKRLSRVSQLQFLSSQTGINWAQLEALQQSNIIEEALTEIPKLENIKNNVTQLTITKENDD